MPAQKRNGLFYALLGLIVLFLIATLLRPLQDSTPRASTRRSKGKLVLFTVARLTDQVDRPAISYAKQLKEDREQYCAQHECTAVFKDVDGYVLSSKSSKMSPDSWGKVAALRAVLEEHPDAEWVWFLDSESLIMDHSINLRQTVLEDHRLDKLMQRNTPIVPPDSLIRTDKTMTPKDVSLVISHDHAGLTTHSFVLRNDDFSRYLLDLWNAPLYRSYNYDRQETAALEHIEQWHYTILARTASVPKRVLAGYLRGQEDETFRTGDFVLTLDGCRAPGRSCEQEFVQHLQRRTNVQRTPATAQDRANEALAEKVFGNV
ncbi:putative alpha-1,6-mannosyltransferase mnn11 [Savitreella phatthalungensis]